MFLRELSHGHSREVEGGSTESLMLSKELRGPVFKGSMDRSANGSLKWERRKAAL